MDNDTMGAQDEGDFLDHGGSDSQNMIYEGNNMIGDISTTFITCKVKTAPVLNRTKTTDAAVVDFTVSWFDDHKTEHRITVKAWNKLAEMIEKVVVPDMSICIIGTLTQERWPNKTTGKMMQKHVISAKNVSVPLMLADAVIEAEDEVFEE